MPGYHLVPVWCDSRGRDRGSGGGCERVVRQLGQVNLRMTRICSRNGLWSKG